MEIQLKKDFVASLAQAVNATHPVLCKHLLSRINRYGEESLTLDTNRLEELDEGLTPAALEDLVYEHARAVKAQGVMMYIGSIRLVLKDVKRSKPGSLAALQAALRVYFLEDALDGWLYKECGDKFLPFVINGVYLKLHTTREKSEGAKDYVRLSFVAHSTAGTARSYRNTCSRRDDYGSEYDSVSWEWGDFNKKTVPDLLAEKGLFHERPELKADYLRQLALFDAYRPRFGEQFVGVSGSLEMEFDPDDNSEYRSRRNRELVSEACYINDDGSVERAEMAEERENTHWVETTGLAEDSPLFRRIPVHPYLRMFNLGTHAFAFKHVDDVRPYVYREDMADKIVLPEAHRDLIEVLTTDFDAVLGGDVVEGKGTGACILCKGQAGLGKTLTAEISSEVSRKPLYKVHSGQLGTDAQEVEKTLKVIFGRAERWGCILLLDEADVYIRRRGDDLDHNAVVAAFLRTMEYFGGTFFMTTNRADDVDDAIESRCVAIILYEMPSARELRRIFEIQSESWGAELSESDLEKLVSYYDGSCRDATSASWSSWQLATPRRGRSEWTARSSASWPSSRGSEAWTSRPSPSSSPASGRPSTTCPPGSGRPSSWSATPSRTP